MSKRILLDTNILIHREIPIPARGEIGVLFRWLDNLGFIKCVHPSTVQEVQKLSNEKTRAAFNIKLDSYNVLRSQAPLAIEVQAISQAVDVTPNDTVDTILLNEVFCARVDFLLTEDNKIHRKAAQLGISERVFKIDAFLEKVTAENPELVDYKIPSVKKTIFGDIDLSETFFDSFKNDYLGFEHWFNRKAEETAYICTDAEALTAFLYLKVENEDEPYNDIEPTFPAKKRLKIGTLKVELNGYKIGERFLKIIFDNAMRAKVEEIYVTIFNRNFEQKRLINLLLEFGFKKWGVKKSASGKEWVLVRDMQPQIDRSNPRNSFPFISRSARAFIVPIYPEYHTSLFPDSILNTESPDDFVEQEPHRNAISKAYISRSHRRDLQSGDIIIFYRTGGYYRSVVTSVGIVENVVTQIPSQEKFIEACRKRSVFSDDELKNQWDYIRSNRPFVVNFLYAYAFPNRPNMAKLIEIGVIADHQSAPRGFELLTPSQLQSIFDVTNTDDHFIVD